MARASPPSRATPRKAGVRSVNISLDALDPAVSTDASPAAGLATCLAGIRAAADAGSDG